MDSSSLEQWSASLAEEARRYLKTIRLLEREAFEGLNATDARELIEKAPLRRRPSMGVLLEDVIRLRGERAVTINNQHSRSRRLGAMPV